MNFLGLSRITQNIVNKLSNFKNMCVLYMDIIDKVYRSPKSGLIGVNELYRKVKEQNKHITIKQVREYLNNQYSKQIHKPIRKPKFYFPITSDDDNDIFQIDLMDMKNISTVNKNYKWIFVCIDVYTRKAYVIPMKDKTTLNIVNSFQKVLQQAKPHKVTCDQGK